MRKVKVERKTKEVNITLELDVDGVGKSKVETGIKFLDHLLVTLAKHGLFNLKIKLVETYHITQLKMLH